MQAFRISVFLWIAALPFAWAEETRLNAESRPSAIELPKLANHYPAVSTRITYHKLKRAIEDKLIEDLDTLLTYISETREFDNPFAHFVLFHWSQSFSRDEISPQYPRIVFHKDGFIGALTGDPDAKGQPAHGMKDADMKGPQYESLPIIELDNKGKDFAFRLIEFKKPDTRGGVRTVCNDEPGFCARCHGTSLRPIIGLNAGAAGAFHDGDAEAQKKQFDTFSKSLDKAAMKRYRFFLRKGDDYRAASAFRHLSLHANHLNFVRIQTRLEKSKVYRPYRYAIYAALLDCDDIETFLPLGTRIAHRRKIGDDFPALVEETRRILGDELKAMQKKSRVVERATAFEASAKYINQVAKLRYILEGQGLDSDYDMREWSPSFAPTTTSYGFNAGELTLDDFLRREFLPALREKEPRLPDKCADLKALSLDVLTPKR